MRSIASLAEAWQTLNITMPESVMKELVGRRRAKVYVSSNPKEGQLSRSE